ncbi:MAG: dihydroneopterin aldolase [Candidatus Latescibacteria bacterium]|nr:dihydroneopterin aldolase [Candidatus Latescibacterota bacterium]
MDILRLKNMRFYGYHGVLPEEKRLGQWFEVDLEVKTDLQKASLSDQLEDTLDYSRLLKLVQEVVTREKFNLIEALAERIAQRTAESFPVRELIIRVRKPNPPSPVHFNGVEVEIHRVYNNPRGEL